MIQKTISTQFGINANYFRVRAFTLDLDNSKAVIEVSGWVDQTSFTAANLPISRKSYYVNNSSSMEQQDTFETVVDPETGISSQLKHTSSVLVESNDFDALIANMAADGWEKACETYLLTTSDFSGGTSE